MFRLLVSGVGVLGLLLLGCGGGSSNSNNSGGTGGSSAAGTGTGSGGTGAGGSVGGVAASTKFGAATAADLTMLCNATKSDLMGLAMSYCVLDGLGEANQAACDTKRTACIADPKKVPTIDCTHPADFTGCEVTVGEFQSCLSELVSYFKMLSCADVGKTTLPNPPTCYSTLMAKCQSLFGASGAAGSGSAGTGSAGTGH